MTTTSIHWSDLYRQAHDLFGETIGATAEATILTHFQENPQRVTDAIHHVAGLKDEGKIRSTCWGTVAAHLDQHTTRREQAVDDHTAKKHKTRLAEHLIRNTGHEIPNEIELHDEIFGDRGLLKDWPDDQQLQERITRLWESVRA